MYDAIVLGLGATGQSVVKFLAHQGSHVLAWDTRLHLPDLEHLRTMWPDVEYRTGPLEVEVLKTTKRIILSPGLPPQLPELQAMQALGIPVIGDIELFYEHANAPIIGITGSNGKSTVTTLVAELLRAAQWDIQVGGNLGEPALNLLTHPSPDAYVLELSSFQLETTQHLRCEVAVFLNLSEDHLDRHGSMDAYRSIKQNIYRGAKYAVVNRDDPATWPSAGMERMLSAVQGFTRNIPKGSDFGLATFEGEMWLMHGEQPLLPTGDLTLQGTHNHTNALAALAVVDALKVSVEQVLPALSHFHGLPHRCVMVAQQDGVRYINDSKATNVASTEAALEGFLGCSALQRVVLIAGGDGKGQDFTPLRRFASQLRGVVLLGQDAGRLEQVFSGLSAVQRVVGLQEAVQEAVKLSCSGDIVLLSPACSSLDMFKNYAERGDLFQRYVREIVCDS